VANETRTEAMGRRAMTKATTKATPDSEAIYKMIETELRLMVASEDERTSALEEAADELPEDVLKNLDGCLGSKSLSYRDAMPVILATARVAGMKDVRVRSPGMRGAGDKMATKLYPELHISGGRGPFQVIGKNSTSLIRGNVPAFDRVVEWAANADDDLVRVAHRYSSARIWECQSELAPLGGTLTI
jgi:hypothetical protein